MKDDHDHEITPVVTYKKITAFVGHSFAKEDHELVRAIKHLLESLGIRCDSGEKPEGSTVSEKILARIKRNDLFVGVFTKGEKLPQNNKWTTSNWVIEEKASAISAQKRLLLLVEEGVEDFGGLQGDYEYVKFNREHFYEALPKIVDYIISFTTVSVSTFHNADIREANNIDYFLQQISRGTASEDIYVQVAKIYRVNRNFQAAEKILTQGLGVFPDSFEIKHALANTLKFLDRLEDSRSLFLQLINLQPENPSVHHNFAHFLERIGELDKALEHFQLALDLEPISINFKCYGKCLYKKAMSLGNETIKKETLKKAKRLFLNAQKLGDEKLKKELEGFLIHIDTLLEEPSHP